MFSCLIKDYSQLISRQLEVGGVLLSVMVYESEVVRVEKSGDNLGTKHPKRKKRPRSN